MQMASIDGLDELLTTLSGLGGDVKQSCLKGGRRGMKKVQKNAKCFVQLIQEN